MSYHGFHAVFVLFGNIYEQRSQLKIEIVKVGKILGCLKFGSADGLRVRGGRSAVHEICHQRLCRKMFQPQKYASDGPPRDRGRSAGHRCNRLVLDTLVVCPLSKARTVR